VEFDFVEDATFELHHLDEGATASATVWSADRQRSRTVSVTREGDRLTVRSDGAWKLLLVGRSSVSEGAGYDMHEDPMGVLVSSDAAEVSIS
jgi:hypothetical protein